MYTVVWNNENWEEFEEQFDSLEEAQCFMEDLPASAQLYYEDDIRVRHII